MFELFDQLDHSFHVPPGGDDVALDAVAIHAHGHHTHLEWHDDLHVPHAAHNAVAAEYSDPADLIDRGNEREEHGSGSDFDRAVHRPTAVMGDADFTSNGSYDPVHHCNVLGDVTTDMRFIHQQTHGSCSLMAQEQFVERMRGIHVPEATLERMAGEWGVYAPDGGTTFPGHDAILDYFDIPHQRFTHASTEMLDQATSSGHDALVSVDARHFYQDPTIPPDSGHAVAIVGKGVDPANGATRGYYFTDSNLPGTARFLTTEEVADCWYRDMITVPTLEA